MNTDDPDYERRRDQLIRDFAILDSIRAGRGTPADSELNASRLAILDGDAPPPTKPRLRVIKGGKN